MPTILTIPVRISAACMRQRFNGCDPAFIRTVCRAACCDAPTRPGGMLVVVHPDEAGRVAARGGRIELGLLQPAPGTRGCPFKDRETFLCGLHGTPAKPFGCVASPFTLSRRGTLIVRNRYRLLRCYNAGRRLPAYRAFYGSLVRLFGPVTAEWIGAHLDAGGGDVVLNMPMACYRRLRDNDAVKRGPAPGG